MLQTVMNKRMGGFRHTSSCTAAAWRRRVRRARHWAARCAAVLASAACCFFSSPSHALAELPEGVMQGRASWYGTTAHGKRTANGEIFNRYSLTAAHKKLPFGTVLRVHNMRNGKEVLVRINDRGPYIEGRVLDLSHRAAEILRMKGSGVTPIAFEVVSNGEGKPIDPENAFYVHISSDQNPFRAKQMSAELEANLKQPVRVLLSITRGRISYVLCLGPYSTFGKAQRAFTRLEEKKLAARNIIEAPWDGGIIANSSLNGTKGLGAPKKASSALTAEDDKSKADAESLWNTMLHAVSTLTPSNHLVTFALSKLY